MLAERRRHAEPAAPRARPVDGQEGRRSPAAAGAAAGAAAAAVSERAGQAPSVRRRRGLRSRVARGPTARGACDGIRARLQTKVQRRTRADKRRGDRRRRRSAGARASARARPARASAPAPARRAAAPASAVRCSTRAVQSRWRCPSRCNWGEYASPFWWPTPAQKKETSRVYEWTPGSTSPSTRRPVPAFDGSLSSLHPEKARSRAWLPSTRGKAVTASSCRGSAGTLAKTKPFIVVEWAWMSTNTSRLYALGSATYAFASSRWRARWVTDHGGAFVPPAVEVEADRVAAVVADEDAVGVEHRHDLEDHRLAQLHARAGAPTSGRAAARASQTTPATRPGARATSGRRRACAAGCRLRRFGGGSAQRLAACGGASASSLRFAGDEIVSRSSRPLLQRARQGTRAAGAAAPWLERKEEALEVRVGVREAVGKVVLVGALEAEGEREHVLLVVARDR